MFNLGSSYFHVPLTTVRHLLIVTQLKGVCVGVSGTAGVGGCQGGGGGTSRQGSEGLRTGAGESRQDVRDHLPHRRLQGRRTRL